MGFAQGELSAKKYYDRMYGRAESIRKSNNDKRHSVIMDKLWQMAMQDYLDAEGGWLCDCKRDMVNIISAFYSLFGDEKPYGDCDRLDDDMEDAVESDDDELDFSMLG